MTMPSERTRALVDTKRFLEDLLDPRLTPRVPARIRTRARCLLRHYPTPSLIALVHDAVPIMYGPVEERGTAHD